MQTSLIGDSKGPDTAEYKSKVQALLHIVSEQSGRSEGIYLLNCQ